MASQISRIIPLLVITLFCIGAVEGGYSVLEYFLFRQPVNETVIPGAKEEKEEQVSSAARRDPSIILTRNLFGPTFESEDAPAASTVDVAANLDKSDLEIVLVGTIGGGEGNNRAIILDKKTRKQDLYKEGDEIKGASVKEILRGKVILDVEGKEELLDMSEAASVRPTVKMTREPAQRPIQPDTGMGGGGRLGQGSGAEREGQREAAVTAEIAPVAEDAAGAVEEPPVETVPESGPEAVVPVAPDVVPEALPEAAPPAEERQSTEGRIIRPRVIRPYRSP